MAEESDKVEETSTEVAVQNRGGVATQDAEAEDLLPNYYPPRMYSPWELPANTAVAQQYINSGLLVDESLVPPDDVLAAANSNIELYGHPQDPRLNGGSLLESPVPLEDLARPGKVELEMPEPRTEFRTWGEKVQEESEETKV